MLEEGCFRDIDVALMMHGSPTTTCDIKSMANYHIDVVFEGKSSHAAITRIKDAAHWMLCCLHSKV